MGTYSIGDLAREFGITLRSIRFYEDEGLLNPQREGLRRIFGEAERTRLKLILRGKRLGFSLSEIAEILDLYASAQGEAKQLRYLLKKIAARQEELHAKHRDIQASLQDLESVAASCRERLKELKSPESCEPTAVLPGQVETTQASDHG